MSDIVNKENNGKLVRIGIKYFKIIQHPNYGTILKPFNGTFAKIEIENNPSLLVKKFVDFIDFDSGLCSQLYDGLLLKLFMAIFRAFQWFCSFLEKAVVLRCNLLHEFLRAVFTPSIAFVNFFPIRCLS